MPRKRTRASREDIGKLQGRNVHRVGSNFVDDVVACRWVQRPDPTSTDQEQDLADQIEFRCRLQGWDPASRNRRIEGLLTKQCDGLLAQALIECDPPILLFFPQTQFPKERPEAGDSGWWYQAHKACVLRRCDKCWQQKLIDQFSSADREKNSMHSTCEQCRGSQNKQRRGKVPNDQKRCEGCHLYDCGPAIPRSWGRPHRR